MFSEWMNIIIAAVFHNSYGCTFLVASTSLFQHEHGITIQLLGFQYYSYDLVQVLNIPMSHTLSHRLLEDGVNMYKSILIVSGIHTFIILCLIKCSTSSNLCLSFFFSFFLFSDFPRVFICEHLC